MHLHQCILGTLCHIGIIAHACCRSVEDTEKLRRKYLRAKRFYEEKVRSKIAIVTVAYMQLLLCTEFCSTLALGGSMY